MRGSSLIGGAALAGALLFVGTGASGADHLGNECREAQSLCNEGVRAEARLCRQDCENAAGEAGEADGRSACHGQCRASFVEDRGECRREVHECRLDRIDDLDPECVDVCREEFAECFEANHACRDDCRTSLETAIAECRDLNGDDEAAFRECRQAAHQERLECKQACHDANDCSGIRDCLAVCADSGA